jgi:hypothetical protein
VALVDDADFATVAQFGGRWYANPAKRTFYARKHFLRAGNHYSVTMHGLITGWPLVDHRNGDGLDNRRENLRPATQSQNSANRAVSNPSGYKGVNWYKRTGIWRATVQSAGKSKHLGYFRTPEEAARAYDAAAFEVWGEYAVLNFPKELIT